MPVLRIHQRAVIWVTGAIVAGTGAVWIGHDAWAAYQNSHTTPSCSWPMRVRGKPAPAQAGLVRCYLQALARRDTAALLAVAGNIPPVRITKADLAHSADARAGQATVTFEPASTDIAYVPLIITYADGDSDNLGIENMDAMGGPSVWRMTIGTDVSQGPPGPSPASTAIAATRSP